MDFRFFGSKAQILYIFRKFVCLPLMKVLLPSSRIAGPTRVLIDEFLLILTAIEFCRSQSSLLFTPTLLPDMRNMRTNQVGGLFV